MTTRREWVTAATQFMSVAEADAIWSALEGKTPSDPGAVLNAALLVGVPPSKAEDAARLVASSQQTTPAPAPAPKEEPKSGNGRRKKVEPEPEADPLAEPTDAEK